MSREHRERVRNIVAKRGLQLPSEIQLADAAIQIGDANWERDLERCLAALVDNQAAVMNGDDVQTESELSQDIEQFLATDHFARRMPGSARAYAGLLSRFLAGGYRVTRST